MKQTTHQFSKLLFFSGAFNIVLALPLAFPILHAKYLRFLWAVNQFLALGGREIVPPSEGIPALLINTAGIDLVLIGVIVLYAGFDPLRRRFIPLANAVGRTLFAAVIGYYVLAQDVARLVLVIGGIDVIISIGFAYYLIRLGNAGETN
ncbi:MAG: hypothetical protein HY869_07630 [Chloroflexi bacterium]|nr:hypothetical protein [Chloroflexota bacterium]